jgi:uncharacterized cupin superfamily protein
VNDGQHQISVVRSSDRESWQALAHPPGTPVAYGAERPVFGSVDGRFTTGLWEREPDMWSFERQYDEVALILAGEADIETDDGSVVTIGPGDVLVTPKGSKGTWRVREKIVKLYAIYDP